MECLNFIPVYIYSIYIKVQYFSLLLDDSGPQMSHDIPFSFSKEICYISALILCYKNGCIGTDR